MHSILSPKVSLLSCSMRATLSPTVSCLTSSRLLLESAISPKVATLSRSAVVRSAGSIDSSSICATSCSSWPFSSRSVALRTHEPSLKKPCGSGTTAGLSTCLHPSKPLLGRPPADRLGGDRDCRLFGLCDRQVPLPALVLDLDVLNEYDVRVRVQVGPCLPLRDPAAVDLVGHDHLP